MVTNYTFGNHAQHINLEIIHLKIRLMFQAAASNLAKSCSVQISDEDLFLGITRHVNTICRVDEADHRVVHVQKVGLHVDSGILHSS